MVCLVGGGNCARAFHCGDRVVSEIDFCMDIGVVVDRRASVGGVGCACWWQTTVMRVDRWAD